MHHSIRINRAEIRYHSYRAQIGRHRREKLDFQILSEILDLEVQSLNATVQSWGVPEQFARHFPGTNENSFSKKEAVCNTLWTVIRLVATRKFGFWENLFQTGFEKCVSKNLASSLSILVDLYLPSADPTSRSLPTLSNPT